MHSKVTHYIIIILLLLGACFADSYTKQWAGLTLKGKQPVTMIRGLLDVGFVENRGMVFGILNNSHQGGIKNTLLVMRIILLVIVSVFIVIKRDSSLTSLLPFLLITAGAWGNVFDNFRYGYVIDFIHLRAGTVVDWPFYFNLADAYLCIGMVLVIFMNIPARPAVKSERK
ncbi:MAG: signal peptidase II [Chitinivibrionales bacterium]|nr:signal peptidase II [Chitinivibrionales bacterium]